MSLARVPMPDGVTIDEINTGTFHALVIGSDGKAYAWGSNQDGRLGIGDTNIAVSDGSVEIATQPGITFVQMEAADNFSLALDSDGHVWAWGANAFGQLGDGGKTPQAAPVMVPLDSNKKFTKIAASATRAMAQADDGTSYYWGQTNTNSGTSISGPTAINMPAGVSFEQVDGYQGGFVALGSDGQVYAWGTDRDGTASGGHPTTGSGSSILSILDPTPIDLGTNAEIIAVSAGPTASALAALDADGTIHTWGFGGRGQLGSGEADSTTMVPRTVDNSVCSSFTSVSVMTYQMSATGCDGQLYIWGSFQPTNVPLAGVVSPTKSFVPLLVVEPTPVVTSVTFGGIEGTNLTQVTSPGQSTPQPMQPGQSMWWW